jgi:tetratricopeptide (TPR) repeat protein
MPGKQSAIAIVVLSCVAVMGGFGCQSVEPASPIPPLPALRNHAQLAERVERLGEDRIPSDPHLLESMAKLMFEQQNYPRAIDLLRRALAMVPAANPKRCDLLKLRAEAFLNIEDEESAFENLRECLRVDPNDAEALFSLGGLLMSRHADEPASVAEGIEVWQQLLKRVPDYPQNEMVRKALRRLTQIDDNTGEIKKADK